MVLRLRYRLGKNREVRLLKLKRKLKLGMDLKASEGVQMQLKWPHAFLQYQYVTQSLTYKDLNFQLLVAGELEILSSGLGSNEEIQGRVKLLTASSYEANVYPLKAVAEWYAAYLRNLEMGRTSWAESPYVIGQAILARYKPCDSLKSAQAIHKSGSGNSSGRDPQVWFRAVYNQMWQVHTS